MSATHDEMAAERPTTDRVDAANVPVVTIRRRADVTGPPTKELDLLIDVSRLIWRFWTRRMPTGIDRVCLAYLDHYGERALALVQRGRHRLVLSEKHSGRLFTLLRSGRTGDRARLVRLLASALPSALTIKVRPGTLYLNVGHTGLNEPSLPAWIARNKVRAIYFVHDLIPLTHPEYCRAGEELKHQRRMTNALVSAHGIIGNSRSTLVELSAFADAQGLKMPATAAAWISGPPAPPAPTKSMLGTPYFVVLGTIEGRKNHLTLLEVWRKLVGDLGASAPTLVVIGQRGWEAKTAFQLLDRPEIFSGKLIELSRCPDDVLAAWLGGARALLMPSFTEGFGLPIIEALGFGCPVIASDLPVFREIGGDIPTFVKSDDRDGWERWVRAFAADHPERARQIRLMKDFRRPQWPEHFAIIDEWLAGL